MKKLRPVSRLVPWVIFLVKVKLGVTIFINKN